MYGETQPLFTVWRFFFVFLFQTKEPERMRRKGKPKHYSRFHSTAGKVLSSVSISKSIPNAYLPSTQARANKTSLVVLERSLAQCRHIDVDAERSRRESIHARATKTSLPLLAYVPECLLTSPVARVDVRSGVDLTVNLLVQLLLLLL